MGCGPDRSSKVTSKTRSIIAMTVISRAEVLEEHECDMKVVREGLCCMSAGRTSGYVTRYCRGFGLGCASGIVGWECRVGMLEGWRTGVLRF